MKSQILVKGFADSGRQALRSELPAILARQGSANAVFIAIDPAAGEAAPPIDAIIEIDSADAGRLMTEPLLRQRATLACLSIDSVVRKADIERRADETTPGIALVALWIAREGVPESDIERHWAEHSPLALEVHHGALRYVQNHVRARDDECKPWRGVAVLHFASTESLATGLFRSESDVALIETDVADFVGETQTFLAREFVFRVLPGDDLCEP